MKLFKIITTFIFCAFTMISHKTIAQVDSLNVHIPKKKQKNREFYIGIFTTNTARSTNEDWSTRIRYSDLAADSTYYSYQEFKKYDFMVEGKKGLMFGYNKRRKIFEKLHIKSGFGINIFGFEYTNISTIDTVNILNKYKILTSSTPPTTETTIINDKIYGLQLSTKPRPNGQPYYFVASSLQIPIGLEYTVNEKLFIGGNMNLYFIFNAAISSYIKTQGETKYSFYQTDLISRGYASIHGYTKYNIYKNFFIELNVGIMGDMLKINRFNDYSLLEGYEGINLLVLGGKVGYNF